MSAIMRQGELLQFHDPGVNPYLIPRPALITLSGGRTSAYQLRQIIDAYGGTLPADIHVAFCNTGKEDEATLRFVREIEARWGVKVYWLEFDPEAEERTKFVTFETAARNGEPLAAVIATRPTQHLPNGVSRYCSSTAKAKRMQKLMHHFLGYERWHVAIGFRADEMHRVVKAYARAGRDREYPVCPLAEAGVRKLDIKDFWDAQPFDLQLPNIEGETPMGNCDLCHLKRREKLVNILRIYPERADWWIAQQDRMEAIIANIPQKSPGPDRRHRFFKDGVSYRELLSTAQALNAAGAPMDLGYETDDTGIDCNCTD